MRKNLLFKLIALVLFIGVTQAFGANNDFLDMGKTAFMQTVEEYVVPIAIGIILIICASLIIGGVPPTKAIIITVIAGACFALATKAGGWFVNWGKDFENKYGAVTFIQQEYLA